jgi:aspartate-semialdehyde dehydrogenase
LEERNFPLSDISLFDVEESAGERLEFLGRSRTVRKLEKDCFAGTDIVFFTADPEGAFLFAPAAAQSGAVVIDLSGAFRADPNVPLVVPEVNPLAASRRSGIIASPSSFSVALAMVLKPIHETFATKRVVLTAFESVSGTGKRGMDELAQQTVALLNFRDVETSVYPYQIAFNCLPQVGAFLENGSTREEEDIAKETRKILEDDSIRISATAVRVPVFRCHAAAISIETAKPATANEVRAILSSRPGVVVYDDPGKSLYPTAIEATGKDEIYVGRIREDGSVPNGMNLWIISDNLRQGVGLNGVQIAELLIS